jgi:hypothetical protein
VLTSTTSNGLTGNSFTIISGSTFIPPVSPFTASGTQTFTTSPFTGGTNFESFVLETLSEGIIMNSTGPTGLFNTLLSGSVDNLRWEITSPNINDGTFSLLIRQGNDTIISPSILENWGPLSLDPFSSNYIEKVIGNQVENILQDAGEYYVQMTGSYANNSRYVRVKSVNQTTPNYLDNNGVYQPHIYRISSYSS